METIFQLWAEAHRKRLQTLIATAPVLSLFLPPPYPPHAFENKYPLALVVMTTAWIAYWLVARGSCCQGLLFDVKDYVSYSLGLRYIAVSWRAFSSIFHL